MQDVLFTPLLKGEIDSLEQALRQIEDYQAEYKQQNNTASTDDLDKYLQRIALESYSKALSDSERHLLQILTLFDFPIPQALIIQAAPQLGLDQPKHLLKRLDNFGLLNYWQGKGLEEHISCFGLARKVVKPLTRVDRNFIANICAGLLWQIWFKDFLEEYQVEPTETLKESINIVLSEHFPLKYKGVLPLQSELDQQRIGSLHRLCLSNSITDWDSLGFSVWEFINLFELLLSLHTFEKLCVSAFALDGFSEFQWTGLYKVLVEERVKLLARHPHYISPWDIHVQRFIPLGRIN